jgi:hypothetical protein
VPDFAAIERSYRLFGARIGGDFNDPACVELLKQVVLPCFDWVQAQTREQLTTRIPNKTYFRVAHGAIKTRAINAALWLGDQAALTSAIEDLASLRNTPMEADLINKAVYTCSVAFSCIGDISGDSRKKPGTFFEYLISFLLRRFFNVPARSSLTVQTTEFEERDELKVDYMFDLGARRPKFIVPVKTSTRERIIQVWAHQRIIDGVFGIGRYRGMPIFLAETKTSAAGTVTEICTPLQVVLQNWYIARMWHIVYLDMPAPYARLAEQDDELRIVTLGELMAPDSALRRLVHPTP